MAHEEALAALFAERTLSRGPKRRQTMTGREATSDADDLLRGFLPTRIGPRRQEACRRRTARRTDRDRRRKVTEGDRLEGEAGAMQWCELRDEGRGRLVAADEGAHGALRARGRVGWAPGNEQEEERRTSRAGYDEPTYSLILAPSR